MTTASYSAGTFWTALDAGGGVVLNFTPAGPVTNAVDFAAATSRAFPTGVRGQCPYRTASSSADAAMCSMSGPSLMRGPAGGLDADTYDWRVYNSGSAWGTPAGASLITSLDYLRQCRNTGSTPLFTANIFGGGYTNGYGTWVCQFDNHTNLFNPGGYGTNAVTGTAAQLAADWVRYCNIIVQTYRQGQESLIGSDTNFSAADNAENLRVYNSVKLGGNWGGRDVLLAGGEASGAESPLVGGRQRAGGGPCPGFHAGEPARDLRPVCLLRPLPGHCQRHEGGGRLHPDRPVHHQPTEQRLARPRGRRHQRAAGFRQRPSLHERLPIHLGQPDQHDGHAARHRALCGLRTLTARG